MRVNKHSEEKNFDILVFGGALVEQVIKVPRLPKPNQDNVHFKRMAVLPGGSGANVAVFGARLNSSTRLMDKWGNDEFANFLETSLGHEGVDLELCKRINGVPTPYMIILSLPENDWSGIIRVAPETIITPDDFNFQDIMGSKYLHFHGFCLGSKLGREGVDKAIQLANRYDVQISMDASTPIAMEFPKILLSYLKKCSIVFLNRLEAKLVTGKTKVSAMAKYLRNFGIEIVVIKAGENGSYVSFGNTGQWIPSHNISVVDTVGAGDAVVAGTLSGLCRGLGILEAVNLGTATSAIVCQSFGAQSRKFSLSEVENFLVKK